jgi:hypothetical protein
MSNTLKSAALGALKALARCLRRCPIHGRIRAALVAAERQGNGPASTFGSPTMSIAGAITNPRRHLPATRPAADRGVHPGAPQPARLATQQRPRGQARSWVAFLEALGGVSPFEHILETVKTGRSGTAIAFGMDLFELRARQLAETEGSR